MKSFCNQMLNAVNLFLPKIYGKEKVQSLIRIAGCFLPKCSCLCQEVEMTPNIHPNQSTLASSGAIFIFKNNK